MPRCFFFFFLEKSGGGKVFLLALFIFTASCMKISSYGTMFIKAGRSLCIKGFEF